MDSHPVETRAVRTSAPHRPSLWLIGALIIGLLLVTAGANAANVEIGQTVLLKATKPIGVPLHPDAHSTVVSGRAADGTRAEVRGLTPDHHWVQLHLEDGRDGWVTAQYIDRAIEPPGPTDTDDAAQVWASADGCQAVVGAGRRAAPTRAEVLRMGSWNIRWFPDGGPGQSPSESPTNVAWLACAITWMNVDVLAVVEIKDYPAARTAMQQVLQSLQVATGTPWAINLQECGDPDAQHVGFLWNTARAELTGFQDVWQFNGAATGPATACATQRRPGRHATIKGAGGGVDFHAIAVHLKSGATATDQSQRFVVLNRLDTAVAPFVQDDADLIVLGDFNTMGNGAAGSEAEELQLFTMTASVKSPGFRRLTADPPCTEYFQGRGGWLDHILVTRQMAEVTVSKVQVSGYCAVRACGFIGGEMPAAYRELSDHCPLLFEIANQDLD